VKALDPRIPVARATFRQELVKCGKPKCWRCRRKPVHGPYWYAYWALPCACGRDLRRHNTPKCRPRTRSVYVGKKLPAGLRPGQCTPLER